MAHISWGVTVQVDGREVISAATAAQTTEATATVQVVIAPGDADKVVDLMPGSAASVQLLLIKSSFYGAQLSFKASDGNADSAAVTLQAPQTYTNGSVALFGVAPNQLKFTNTSPDQNAEVQIFVARDATP